MPENSTVIAIKQAYATTVMQLFNIYLNTAHDSSASERFKDGLLHARLIRDNCLQIAAQYPDP